jgi:hypothetical protein
MPVQARAWNSSLVRYVTSTLVQLNDTCPSALHTSAPGALLLYLYFPVSTPALPVMSGLGAVAVFSDQHAPAASKLSLYARMGATGCNLHHTDAAVQHSMHVAMADAQQASHFTPHHSATMASDICRCALCSYGIRHLLVC